MDPHTWGLGKRHRVKAWPRSVLRLVEERQGGRYCVHCREQGLTTPEGEPIEVDHRLPLSKGGDNQHLNLMFACRAHNRARGGRLLREGVERPHWLHRRR